VLHQALVDSIGEREANVLMDLLPSQDWNAFVRREDLEQASTTLRLEIQTLRLEMQASESRLSATFHRDMVRQTWILAGTLLAGMSALGGLLH
jgi:hypothetical protein